MWTNVLRPIGDLASFAVTAPPYRIRRSNRALHARIQVDADGVEVVVPRRFPLRNVEPFVEEKRPWIERTLRRMRESEAEFPPAAAGRRRRGALPRASGWRCGCGWSASRSRAHVARRGDELRVKLRARRTTLRDALEAGTGARRGAEVAPRLDAAVAPRRARATTRLQIRGQRTRWASCSTSGAMSFNWRLLLAPAEILDYVVEHEVAHLDVQDHSQRFWRLLASRCPAWREHERGCAATAHCACAYSQRKKRTARNSPAAAQAATTSAAVPVSPPPPTIAGRQPVDQVLQRQRLGDRLQRLGQVVGRVEDARDEDQRQEDRVRVRGRRRPRSGSRARRRRRARRSRPRRAA